MVRENDAVDCRAALALHLSSVFLEGWLSAQPTLDFFFSAQLYWGMVDKMDVFNFINF